MIMLSNRGTALLFSVSASGVEFVASSRNSSYMTGLWPPSVFLYIFAVIFFRFFPVFLTKFHFSSSICPLLQLMASVSYSYHPMFVLSIIIGL
jgi:hypothetical protein